MIRPRQRRVLVYVLSACLVFAVVLLRLGLNTQVEGSSAYLLFLAVVMASAWLGGVGPGLFATVLSSLAGNFFFTVPRWSIGLERSRDALDIVLFLVEGVVIAGLAGQLHRARDAAVAGQAEARELERRILEVTDAEQRRIGHDLHDGLGQHLTGVALLARRLEHRLAAEKSPQAEHSAQIAALVKTAIELTQDISRSLSPAVLERGGLADALQELAANSERLLGIRCVTEFEGPPPALGVETAVHFYRIAQEAVSNAVKHGRATVVRLRLETRGPTLLMQVADNGTGMKPRPNDGRGGSGLRIMQYRARMIGAEIDVGHGNEGGAVITCRYTLTTAQGAKD